MRFIRRWALKVNRWDTTHGWRSKVLALILLLVLLIQFRNIPSFIQRAIPFGYSPSFADDVWFEVETPSSPNQNVLIVSGERIKVQESPINLEIHAPIGRNTSLENIEVYVNGANIGDGIPSNSRIYTGSLNILENLRTHSRSFPNLNLRRSNNRIFVQQTSELSKSFNRLYIGYEPIDKLKPIFTSWFIQEDDSKILSILGLAEPDSTLFLRINNGAINPSFTDDAGFFRLIIDQQETLNIEQQKILIIEAAAKEEDFKAKNVTTLQLDQDQILKGFNLLDSKILITPSEDFEYLQFRFNVKIPQGTALYEWIESEQVGAAELASFLFDLRNNNLPLYNDFSGPTNELVENRLNPVVQNGVVNFELNVKIPPQESNIGFGFGYSSLATFPEIQLRLPETKLIRPIISGNDVVQDSSGVTTYIWNSNSLRELILSRRNDFTPIIKTLGTSSANPTNSYNENRLRSLVTILGQVQRNIPDIINSILYTAFYLIPYIWVIILFKLRKVYPTISSMRSTMMLLSVASIAMSIHSLILISDIERISSRNLNGIYSISIVGISFLILPLFRAFKEQHTLQTRKSVIFCQIAASFFVSLALLISYYSNSSPLLGYTIIISLLLSLTCLISIFFYWLICTLVNHEIDFLATIKAVWLMLLLPLIPDLLNSATNILVLFLYNGQEDYRFNFPISSFLLLVPRQPGSFVWLLLGIIVGSLLMYSLLIIAADTVNPDWKSKIQNTRIFNLGLIGFTILTSIPINPSEEININSYTVESYASLFSHLLPYLLLLSLIVFLQDISERNKFSLDATIKSVGALIFAFYLTARTANILFVFPLLLIGWYSFLKWVLIHESYQTEQVSFNYKRSLVHRLLEFKEAENLRRERRNNLNKQLLTGSIKLSEWRESNIEFEKNENRKRAFLNKTIKEPNLDFQKINSSIFSSGPESSPWENAKVASLYGFFLSLPFTLQTFVSIFRTQEVGTYPFLSILEALFATLASWVLIAFIFGYFFHLIRGSTGLQKGLVYVTALLGPSIFLRLVNEAPFLDQSHLSQVFQIFTYVLLLGLLAFDLRSLQKLNYGWREFLGLYGLATLSISIAPSILLTVISGITGQEPIELLKQALNLLLGVAN